MLKSTSFPLISCDHKKHMAIQCLRYIIGYKNGIFLSRRKGNASESQHFHWFISRYFLFISVGLCTLSVAVLSMWPCKNISHIQVLVTYFRPTPPIKLKLGVQIGGETTIANHKDQSLWSASQEQGPAVRSYLLHSSLPGVKLCDAFYQPQQTVQKCWAKTILLSNSTCFDFSSSGFDLQGHILSTGGVALTSQSSSNSMKKMAKPLCHSSFACSFPATRMNTWTQPIIMTDCLFNHRSREIPATNTKRHATGRKGRWKKLQSKLEENRIQAAGNVTGDKLHEHRLLLHLF